MGRRLRSGPTLRRKGRVTSSFSHASRNNRRLTTGRVRKRDRASASLSLNSCVDRSSVPSCGLHRLGRQTRGGRSIPFSIDRSLGRCLLRRLKLQSLPRGRIGVTRCVVKGVSSSNCLHHSLSTVTSSLIFRTKRSIARGRVRAILTVVRSFSPTKINTHGLRRYLLLRLTHQRGASRAELTALVLASFFRRFAHGRCSGVVGKLSVSRATLGETVHRVAALSPGPYTD